MSYISNHKLEIICDTERVKCFRLYDPKKPESNMMTTYFTFNPYGILINGDYTASPNADICNFKSLEWFLGDLPPDYLAEKFQIERKFDPEYAKRFLEELKEEDEEIAIFIEEFIYENEYEFFRFLSDQYPDCIVDLHFPREKGAVERLSQLQKQFAKAYKELYE